MTARSFACVLAIVLAGGGAFAQEGSSAHMEGCLIWSGQGTVGARNECSRPITLMFMILDGEEIVTTELSPGGRFISDAQWGQPGGFIFTACPAGYKPNVRFAVENKEAIGLSLYNCIGGKPNS